jgi:hypothetical protein
MAQTTAQTQILDPKRARHGVLLNPMRDRIRNYSNNAGADAQVSTLTVATYTDSATYSWQIDNIADSYTEDGDADADAVAVKIAAKINANPRHRGRVTAAVATNVVTLTGTKKGRAFVLVADDAKLTVATTTDAALAGAIGAGIALVRGTQPTGDDSRPAAELPDPADYTAKTLDITYGSGTVDVLVGFDGQKLRAGGASAAALASAIDALFTGLSASEAAGVVTVSVDTALDTFELVGVTGDAAVTSLTEGDALADVLVGVTGRTELNVDGLGYNDGRGPDVLEDGGIVIDFGGAPTLGRNVYMGTTTSERGKLYKERATGRVWAPMMKVEEVRDDYGFVRVAS